MSRRLFTVGPVEVIEELREAMARPMIIHRGKEYKQLHQGIVEKMRKVHPGFEYVEVPNTGHAPLMTEPVAYAAIEKFIEKFG